MGTVLHDAIEDATNPRRSSRRESTVTRDARLWILGEPDRTRPRRWRLGDFEPLCTALGVDPEAVRQHVRDVLEGRVERTRRCRLVTVRTKGSSSVVGQG